MPAGTFTPKIKTRPPSKFDGLPDGPVLGVRRPRGIPTPKEARTYLRKRRAALRRVTKGKYGQ